MTPRSLDLIIRSLTTSCLAIGTLVLAAYQVINGGEVDTSVGAFVGLVLGFYFGAHVSVNGSGAQARATEIAVSQATVTPLPHDPLSEPIRKER